jgi:protoheme IX farnesyltransferase
MILVPLGIAPWPIGYAGLSYGIVALATGAVMIALALQVLRDADARHPASRKLFGFSILYLFLLFAALLVDRLVTG